MPVFLPVGMQDFMHGGKPEMQAKKIRNLLEGSNRE